MVCGSVFKRSFMSNHLKILYCPLVETTAVMTRGSSVCGRPSEFVLLRCHGTTVTGFLCLEETRGRQTAWKRETRGNTSSLQIQSQSRNMKTSIKRTRYETDKSRDVFRPAAIPLDSETERRESFSSGRTDSVMSFPGTSLVP